MKRKQFFRRFAAVLLCLALFVPCAMHSLAAEPDSCSIKLSYTPDEQPMEGVTFRAYRVADVDTERVTYHPTETYEGYNVLNASGSWLSRAATLAGYVARDKLTADREGITDENGVSFDDLEPGLYLITGTSAWKNGALYTPTPFLISLPYTEDGYSWEYDISTHAKYSYFVPGSNTVQRHAIKVWEDEDHEDVRPAEVTVDLLQDGEVYATTVLSSDNNWRCDWTELPYDHDYQVVERSAGERYNVSVEQTGITSVITNSYIEDIDEEDDPLIDRPDVSPEPSTEPVEPSSEPADPSGEPDASTEPTDPEELVDIDDEDSATGSLPYTGMLWWPVPVLVIAGFVLLSLGIVRHRRGANEGEK